MKKQWENPTISELGVKATAWGIEPLDPNDGPYTDENGDMFWGGTQYPTAS